MTWREHLSELQSRLRIVLIALVISCTFTWLPLNPAGFLDPVKHYQPIMSLVLQKIKYDFLPPQATLIAGGLVDTIFVYMYLSLLIGIVISYPVIAYEVYAFVRPGLYPHERKNITSYMLSFVGLFIFGLAMAYFLIIPLTFKILTWFIQSAGAQPFINIKDFYNWALSLLLVSGLFYTVPVFVVMLVQFRVLRAKALSGTRTKITAYLIMLVVLTIITPDPTPITATIILVPFIAILEMALLVARRIDRGYVETAMYEGGAVTLGVGASDPARYRCKFCGALMNTPSSFCTGCGKSQV